MKLVRIAFDCDGTLIKNGALEEHEIVPNERIRSLLISLAHFKNVEIIVWSGGGELWARQVANAIGIHKYVDTYASKNLLPNSGDHPTFSPDILPEIAIDDIQDCELGIFNLIVREK